VLEGGIEMGAERARCIVILLIDRLGIQSEGALALGVAALLLARYIECVRLRRSTVRTSAKVSVAGSRDESVFNKSSRNLAMRWVATQRWRHGMEKLKSR